MTSSTGQNFRPQSAATALLLLILFLGLAWMVLSHITTAPLKDYDESIYAQVAKQVLQNKNYLDFQWQGNVGLGRTGDWFEKPPLIIWLLVLSYKLLGVNELSSRIWVALFAFASIVFSIYAAKKLFNSKLAAVFTLAFFYLCYQYIQNASILQFDTIVGFFILVSLAAFYLAEKNSKYYYLFWTAMALGLLSKSAIGLLPLPIIFIYSIFPADFNFLKVKDFWLAFLAFLVLALPWHLYNLLVYGRQFWAQYFGYHLFQRFSSVLENNGGGWNYYLQILANQRLLFFFSVFALAYLVYRSLKKDRPSAIVAISIIFIVLFFSSAQTKLAAYILILYPLLAILNGAAWASIISFINIKGVFLDKAAALAIILLCIFSGFRYNHYRSGLQTDQKVLDDKNIGEYLKNAYSSVKLINNSSSETKPAIIFYANRTVYTMPANGLAAEKSYILISQIPPSVSADKIYSASTESAYLVQNETYSGKN